MNWKIIIPIVIVALILAAGLVIFQKTRAPQPVAQVKQAANQQTGLTIPQATGNVDDTANALITDSSNESSLTGNAPEGTLINADNQTISDFGKSYEGTEF